MFEVIGDDIVSSSFELATMITVMIIYLWSVVIMTKLTCS